MKVFNFTLAFSVMAADELDARVKLKELLKSISKEEILWAMQIVDCDRRARQRDHDYRVSEREGILTWLLI